MASASCSHDGERVADQQHGEVDLFGQVGHGGDAGQPEDGVPGGVDGVEAGADPLGPVDELAGDAGVGPALGVGGADDGDGLGPEEPVQVRYVGVQRAAADVQVALARRPAVDGAGPGCSPQATTRARKSVVRVP